MPTIEVPPLSFPDTEVESGCVFIREEVERVENMHPESVKRSKRVAQLAKGFSEFLGLRGHEAEYVEQAALAMHSAAILVSENTHDNLFLRWVRKGVATPNTHAYYMLKVEADARSPQQILFSQQILFLRGVLGVCGAFDQILNPRPYSLDPRPETVDDALKTMRKGKRGLDPAMLEAFAGYVEDKQLVRLNPAPRPAVMGELRA